MSVDPTVNPKTIDLTEMDEKARVTEAIYQFDGDTLIVCAAPIATRNRPTEFAAKRENVILVLKRAGK